MGKLKPGVAGGIGKTEGKWIYHYFTKSLYKERNINFLRKVYSVF
jgi:hypothetical protein